MEKVKEKNEEKAGNGGGSREERSIQSLAHRDTNSIVCPDRQNGGEKGNRCE